MAVTFTSESSVSVPSHSKTRRRFRFKQLWSSQASSILRRAASLIFFFILWQILSTLKVNFFVNFQFIPAPTSVFTAFVAFMQGSPWVHFQSSISRVIGGFFAGSVLGILIGLLIGSSHLLEEIIATPLELFRPIPAVALIPMAILMFPDAEIGMFYITFVGAFYPILVSTQKAVESSLSDLLMIRVGKCLGASYFQLFREIIIKSALPGIRAGLEVINRF